MIPAIIQWTNYAEIKKGNHLIFQGLRHLTRHNTELVIRLGLFADHCKSVYALCIGMVEERIQPLLKGYSGLVVYADDFVVTFQYKQEAEWFYEQLKRRMGNFGLSLEEEKSRLIEFGRFAEENCAKRGTRPETFTFLGFTHYCSKGRNGKFRVKRKTARKKFSKKLKEIHRKIGDMRMMKTKDIVKKLNEILIGYFHYYGITDNGRSIKSFRYEVLKSLFYWLNRRSQKKSYNWVEFLRMLDTCHPLAEARIYVNIYAQ